MLFLCVLLWSNAFNRNNTRYYWCFKIETNKLSILITSIEDFGLSIGLRAGIQSISISWESSTFPVQKAYTNSNANVLSHFAHRLNSPEQFYTVSRRLCSRRLIPKLSLSLLCLGVILHRIVAGDIGGRSFRNIYILYSGYTTTLRYANCGARCCVYVTLELCKSTRHLRNIVFYSALFFVFFSTFLHGRHCWGGKLRLVLPTWDFCDQCLTGLGNGGGLSVQWEMSIKANYGSILCKK